MTIILDVQAMKHSQVETRVLYLPPKIQNCTSPLINIVLGKKVVNRKQGCLFSHCYVLFRYYLFCLLFNFQPLLFQNLSYIMYGLYIYVLVARLVCLILITQCDVLVLQVATKSCG